MSRFFSSLVFLALAFALFWLAHRVRAWRIGKQCGARLHEQICLRNNSALALRLSSFALACALGLSGALQAPSMGFWRDLAAFSLTGLSFLVLVTLAFMLLDRLILPRLDNTKAILEGNMAVGPAEAGGGLATGLILRAAFSGRGSYLAGVVFFLLAQVGLTLFFTFLERLSPYDDQEEIARGNTALGLHLGSMLLALGIIMASAVHGDFSNWGSDLTTFAWESFRGVALLLAGSWLADRLFLGGFSLGRQIASERNTAAVISCMGVKLGLALLIASTA